MNGYNFTERVRKVLALSRDESARLHHEYVGTEHLLLGLLREGEGVAFEVLQKLDADLTGISETVERTLKRGRDDVKIGPDRPYTSRAKKVLELAMAEAREQHHSYVGTEHLLLGLLREEKGIAAQVLVDHGITVERARAELAVLLTSDGAARPSERIGRMTAEAVGRSSERVNDVDPASPWATLVRCYAAFNSRDIDAMGQLWIRSGRASYIDPVTGLVSGWDSIAQAYRRIFDGPVRVGIELHDVSLSETGPFAFVVGVETWTAEGGATFVRSVQTTRILRREGMEWRLIHYHASIADPEQLRAFQELLGGRPT